MQVAWIGALDCLLILLHARVGCCSQLWLTAAMAGCCHCFCMDCNSLQLWTLSWNAMRLYVHMLQCLKGRWVGCACAESLLLLVQLCSLDMPYLHCFGLRGLQCCIICLDSCRLV